MEAAGREAAREGEEALQKTVEQAGLVIANAQKGSLADGWVEYFDKESNQVCLP